MKKEIMYYILALVICIDIFTTYIVVLYLNATEINPLCDNFIFFYDFKILISWVGLIGVWFLRNTLYWKYEVSFLIILYGCVIIKNLFGGVSHFWL